MRRELVAFVIIIVALATTPFLTSSPYLLHILTLSAMYVSFALSFDIGAGHLGTISLAHPAFFCLGAYVVGIFGTKVGTPVIMNLVLALVLVSILALLLARPAFRLREISFAIATLGFALSAQIIVNNWLDVTEGPMCINDVPNLLASISPFVLNYHSERIAFYFIFVAMAVVVAVIYRLLTSGRIGRTFTAMRNDEVLATSVGIDLLRYQRFAFVIGSCMAGVLGALWAHYMRVVCPDFLSIVYTNTLLMMVFVGGAGNFWGVISGALLVTAVPEVLRLTPSLRMILFGAALLAVVISFPDGIAGLLANWGNRLGQSDCRSKGRTSGSGSK